MDLIVRLEPRLRLDSPMMEDDVIGIGRPLLFSFCFLFSWSLNSCVGFALKDCRISKDNAICSASNLQAVPGDIPASVKTFDLAVNKISKIRAGDFINYTALLQLDLKRNHISQIEKGSFTSLRSLRKLNLNNNRLAQLGDVFGGLSNLTELRLMSNDITTVAPSSFQPLTNLTVLDLSFNKLKHLTKVHYALQHLPNLQYLFIRKIGLTIFQSWELTNSTVGLAYLDMSQNYIDVFSISADVFQNLTWLNIGGSQRKQKLSWEIGEPAGLSRVTTLDISGLHLAQKDARALFQSLNFSLSTLRMNTMKCNLRELLNMSCTIPTLTQLQIRRNTLRQVDSRLLRLCSSVTNLDLADNRIQNMFNDSFRALQGLKRLTLSRNRLALVPPAVRNLTRLLELDLSSNNISSLGCQDFAELGNLRVLGLDQNSISTVNQCVFKDLTKLEVLKLQINQITDLNSAFKIYLPNLRQLKLDQNKLTAIRLGDFEGLRSIQNLSMQRNQLRKLENGSFVGLTMLTDILLQSNEIQETDITAGVFNDLISLRKLSLLDNRIKYKSSSALPSAPFSRLSRLETLAMAGQHSRGRFQLPRNFLQGLTNLLIFDARNVHLTSLHQDTFKYTPRLQKLDISSNELTDVSPRLFDPIQDLRSLYISRTSLLSLDFLNDANLTNLEFLQARRNQYSVITKEQMGALPALVYLDLQGNSFLCACDNTWFLQWLNKTETQVFDAYNFVCNYPQHLKGIKLLDLDVRSCSIDVEFIYFISTTCAILLFQLAAFTYHFLRWQLAYAYHLFLALLYKRKFRNRQPECLYDAFVSYNTHDEDWVFRELLPKLEEEQGWKLCLHHRDFEPGKPIIDNITQAIYASRKTICVISRRYLESEWCSREIQVASFRLFDEHKDVLILVFLEDIPVWELSPYYRMRKLLKKWTFLSWPRAAQCTDLFWEKLRQALKTRNNVGGELLLLTVKDST
ncbi:toll-like receptor 22 [Phyllopteryx taeniolatus]|uniref:toll-like receptor 22 n=1 Tax=Phyllopteryx taeniolatus TaxID=161469 RepID=UPI002AD3A352|nr:toll-like receptor 22 [Phyllopteryx taeniolatus]